jgi:ribosome-associated protein
MNPGRGRPKPTAAKNGLRALEIVKDAALNKKAHDIVFLDMRGVVDYLDYLAVCHGDSVIQNRAIADNIVERLKNRDIIFSGIEGYRSGSWILLDFDDFVVHIFLEEERKFYNLEELWVEGKRLEV